MAELMLGRLGNHSPVGTMKDLSAKFKASPAWGYLGWLGILISFVVLSYFSVIAGWTTAYAIYAGEGLFNGATADKTAEIFETFLSNPGGLVLWNLAFMALTVFIVSRGINKGLEKAATILMPLFFVMVLLLAIYSSIIGDFQQGFNYMFDFNLSEIKPDMILIALGQAFLSNSVAMAIMMTYGSYAASNVSLGKSALIITGADTMVALVAGLAIFPLVFTFGLEPSEGPGLIFVTLPIAFGQMPGGQFIGLLFFILLAIAAITSTISLLEPLVSHLTRRFDFKRPPTALIAGFAAFLFGLLPMFSFNIWSDVSPLGWLEGFENDNFFDLIDAAINKVLLPVSGLFIALFVGWKIPTVVSEDNFKDAPDAVFKAWLFLIRYVVPLALLVILAFNIVV
jgi:NSS family neurotransmitter:Na+ symporter